MNELGLAGNVGYAKENWQHEIPATCVAKKSCHRNIEMGQKFFETKGLL